MKITIIQLSILFITLNVIAQDCNKKIEIITKFLETNQEIESTFLNNLDEKLITCQSSDAAYYYVTGLLELNRENPDLVIAHTNFEAAANLGLLKAKTHLAYSFKNGWGGTVDLTQYLDLLLQAADLGDDNATYALAYTYLKGLGVIQQDYTTAFNLIENLDLPMARHWKGICTFYGLGTQQNTELGLQILLENDIDDSHVLANKIINNETVVPDVLEINPISIENYLVIDPTAILDSQFEAKIIERDWSKNFIFRSINAHISFFGTSNNIDIQIELENEVHQGSGYLDQGNILLENTNISLPEIFKVTQDAPNTNYLIEDILVLKHIENDKILLVANIWSESLKEPGVPLLIELFNQEEIDARINSSLEIYPNNFTETFSVQFVIERTSQVSIEIFDFAGMKVREISNHEALEGTQTFNFETTNLIEGMYFAKIQVDNTIFERQLIKTN